MQAMNLFLRDGDVIFHCSGCARDFYVDADKAFVPQLRALSYEHHCDPLVWTPAQTTSASPKIL